MTEIQGQHKNKEDENKQERMYYILSFTFNKQKLCIDARNSINTFGKYINHSYTKNGQLKYNCKPVIFLDENAFNPKPRIIFKSICHIYSNQELFWCYDSLNPKMFS